MPYVVNETPPVLNAAGVEIPIETNFEGWTRRWFSSVPEKPAGATLFNVTDAEWALLLDRYHDQTTYRHVTGKDDKGRRTEVAREPLYTLKFRKLDERDAEALSLTAISETRRAALLAAKATAEQETRVALGERRRAFVALLEARDVVVASSLTDDDLEKAVAALRRNDFSAAQTFAGGGGVSLAKPRPAARAG